MFNYDECNSKNVNQNILGVKWKESIIKRMTGVYISDKKEGD